MILCADTCFRYDTWVRILKPSYYGGEAGLEAALRLIFAELEVVVLSRDPSGYPAGGTSSSGGSSGAAGAEAGPTADEQEAEVRPPLCNHICLHIGTHIGTHIGNHICNHICRAGGRGASPAL